MENLINKLDSYNILNNLLPGIILEFLFENILAIKIVQGNILENLFIYYFLGMIASRIGSTAIEPLCKKIKLIKYAKYGDYLKASKKDEKIDTLSEVNNMFRTVLAVCIITILAKIYIFLSLKLGLSDNYNKIIVLGALCILFAVAYRKQTNYVVNRVEKVNGYKNKQQEQR